MRRGFGRLFAYWRVERRTIAQGLVAMLLASAASLLAGIILGSISNTLERLPGLMVLVPAAIAMRGNIFGALASRLGTSIHTGLFETTRRRGGILYQNLFAATTLTLAGSLLAGALAKLLSEAFGVQSISLLDFVVVSIIAGLLASMVVGGIAVFLSIRAYRRGWDLDSVAAPLVTAAGDVFTVPALFVGTFLVGIRWVTPTIAGLALAVATALFVRSLMTNLPLVRRIIAESLPVLLLAAAIDLLAGLVVEGRLEEFVAHPVLLILIPPIIGNAGGLGGILSSRLSSKLHLGALSPRGLPEGVALLDFSIVFLFALVVFPLVGISAHLFATILGLSSPGIARVIGISAMSGLIATLVAAVVAYYSAVATHRIGLDPDNHGLPLITSSMDFVGVIALVLSLLVFGVGS
ncbi:MAG: magnesium transporter [Actinomycetota bacterium]